MDRELQLAQRRVRLDPELAGEDAAQILGDGEGLGVAPGAVEREHELAVQRLAQRVVGRERGELRDKLAVAAGAQIEVDARLERREAERAEAVDFAAGEVALRQLRERGAAPEVEGHPAEREGGRGVRVRVGLLEQRLEAGPVDLAMPRPQPVAVRQRDEAGGGGAVLAAVERPAERQEMLPDPRPGVRRRVGRPGRVDQAVERDGLVGVEQQREQEGALLRALDRHDGPRVVPDFERSEDAKLHGTRSICEYCADASSGSCRRPALLGTRTAAGMGA